jgi:pilus assembly protein CpaB
MNTKRLITALAIALAISGIFTYWLSQKFSKPRGNAALRHQYVAAALNLEAGEMLKAGSLNLIDWPEATPLTGAFAKPEEVEGRVVLYPLSAGQPILERQLSAPGTGLGLTVKIPDGMRAISLRSDDVVGVAGFLLPGTHVDVLVTYHTASNSDPVTTTILQDVEILAAGQKFQPDPEGKANSVNVVTLLVKPTDAERVVLASSQGIVHFVLRNGLDREQIKGSSMQLSQLDGSDAPRPLAPVNSAPRTVSRAAAPTNSAYVVETVSNGKQSTETFK